MLFPWCLQWQPLEQVRCFPGVFSDSRWNRYVVSLVSSVTAAGTGTLFPWCLQWQPLEQVCCFPGVFSDSLPLAPIPLLGGSRSLLIVIIILLLSCMYCFICLWVLTASRCTANTPQCSDPLAWSIVGLPLLWKNEDKLARLKLVGTRLCICWVYCLYTG